MCWSRSKALLLIGNVHLVPKTFSIGDDIMAQEAHDSSEREVKTKTELGKGLWE
jgi:hypothetical protein